MLAKESELAARDIFGLQEKDISTLQQEAFDQRSVSVWDLEQLEEAYVESGQKVRKSFIVSHTATLHLTHVEMFLRNSGSACLCL